MTRAGFALVLLLVVVFISWRERRIIYPLCAIACGILIASTAGLLGDFAGGIEQVPDKFNTVAEAIFG